MTAPLTASPEEVDARFHRIVDELTRRGFISGGLSAAALLGLAACTTDDTGDGRSAADPAASTAWTYTDDLGREIGLPSTPARIAVLSDGPAATLWAAGLHVVAAPLADGNRPFLTGAGVPGTGVTALGAENRMNVEKLAAARPDLIIDTVDAGTLRATSKQPQIAKIAPVLGLDGTGPDVDAIIDRAHRIVAALGIAAADGQAHADCRAAETRLTKALAAKPGLRAMFCFANGDNGLDIMIADKWPFMQTLAGLGLRLEEAGTGGNGYFTEVSWENVPTLPVDLVVYTGLGLPGTNPGWQAMPAVKAGQYLDSGVGWYAYYYANYVTMLDTLTAAIAKADTEVGPR